MPETSWDAVAGIRFGTQVGSNAWRCITVRRTDLAVMWYREICVLPPVSMSERFMVGRNVTQAFPVILAGTLTQRVCLGQGGTNVMFMIWL